MMLHSSKSYLYEAVTAISWRNAIRSLILSYSAIGMQSNNNLNQTNPKTANFDRHKYVTIMGLMIRSN